jgi:hypothetical protein
VMSGQLHETREFTEKSPHYGGWDLMGASQVIGLTSDTNVSCTCFALEAIRTEREHPRLGKEIARHLERARRWAERCQPARGDGGFTFSPDPASINHKAGWEDAEQTRPKTYASATADGLRCLRYAGAPPGEDRATSAALEYLRNQTSVQHVPGFDPPDDHEPGSDDQADLHGWGMGLRFYYYQSLVKAIAPVKAEWADARRAALRKQLARLQRADGRWENESARMREDDPLIATSLALVALGELG